MGPVIRALLEALKRVNPQQLKMAVDRVRAAGVKVGDGSANGLAQRVGTLVKDNPIKAQIAVSALAMSLPEVSFDFVEDAIDAVFGDDEETKTAIGAVRAQMIRKSEETDGDGDPDRVFDIDKDDFIRVQGAIADYRGIYESARYFFPRAAQLNAILELAKLEPSALKLLEDDYESRRA